MLWPDHDSSLGLVAKLRSKMPNVAVSRGFEVIVVFFLGVLCFELIAGESLGLFARRATNPTKYWWVLTAQACGAVVLVGLLYFATH